MLIAWAHQQQITVTGEGGEAPATALRTDDDTGFVRTDDDSGYVLEDV